MKRPKQDNSVFEALTEVYLLALCIWAEARNQGLDGMQAVGSVILNRAAKPGWWGRDIKSVILCPMQFSWLNSDDPQRVKAAAIAEHFIDELAKSAVLRECLLVAEGIVSGKLSSNVGGATHYHTTEVFPAWRKKLDLVSTIKDHIFYV